MYFEVQLIRRNILILPTSQSDCVRTSERYSFHILFFLSLSRLPQERKAELARQSRQKKTEKLDVLEDEVSRLRARLRLYEPYEASLQEDEATLPGLGMA
jgi:hypothetical protein